MQSILYYMIFHVHELLDIMPGKACMHIKCAEGQAEGCANKGMHVQFSHSLNGPL